MNYIWENMQIPVGSMNLTLFTLILVIFILYNRCMCSTFILGVKEAISQVKNLHSKVKSDVLKTQHNFWHFLTDIHWHIIFTFYGIYRVLYCLRLLFKEKTFFFSIFKVHKNRIITVGFCVRILNIRYS